MRETRLLVLAGHDPTGGAGVDADREAARRFGSACEVVVTAWTRQDGIDVSSIGARSPEEWGAEMEELEPGRFPVWKVGLLPGAAHVVELVRRLESVRGAQPLVVLDPVLSASGGATFLDHAGRQALIRELLPRAPYLTPNLPEAALLTGREPASLAPAEGRLAAARELIDHGAGAVFLKGGHGPGDSVEDLVLLPGAEPVWHRRPRIPGNGIHGSGCRYASALAALLLQGLPPGEAARRAGDWLGELIAARASKA